MLIFNKLTTFSSPSLINKRLKKVIFPFIGYLTTRKRFYNNGACNFLQADLRFARAISRLSNV